MRELLKPVIGWSLGEKNGNEGKLIKLKLETQSEMCRKYSRMYNVKIQRAVVITQ